MSNCAKFVEKNSKGCLSKDWYMIEGKKCLVKGNKKTVTSALYEPYAEVIAYKVASALGMDAVPYWLDEAKNYPQINTYGIGHVSVCENIKLRDNEQLVSFYKLMDLMGQKYEDPLRAYAQLGISYRPLYQMLVFDALIGNTDRHLNNWEYIVSPGGIRPAPILDNGESLMATIGDDDIEHCGDMYPDKSKSFESTHNEMISLLKERKVENLFDVEYDDVLEVFYKEMEEIRGFVGEKRYNKMIQSFELRAEKYLLPFIGKERVYEHEYKSDAQGHDYCDYGKE